MVATIDRGEFGAFVLLDMSAAFDTIDHRIILKCANSTRPLSSYDHHIILDVLQQRINVQDAELDWFASNFGDRTRFVVNGDDSSRVS